MGAARACGGALGGAGARGGEADVGGSCIACFVFEVAMYIVLYSLRAVEPFDRLNMAALVRCAPELELEHPEAPVWRSSEQQGPKADGG